MEFKTPQLLISIVITLSLFWPASPVLAARKMDPIVRFSDTDRALSANESLLLRFRDEREELLRNRAHDKEKHLLKNRLLILNNKIEFLEKEVKRTRPRVSNIKKPKLNPIPIRWKGYQPSEPRRGYLMAWFRDKIGMKDSAPMENRAEPLQAVQPVRVANKPAAEIGFREPAVTQILPQKVDTKPRAELSGRETANIIMRPLAVNNQTTALTELRNDIQEMPLPETPLETPKDFSKHPTAKTGRDWKNMSRGDKEIYILSVMGNLSKRDVYLMKPYNYYVQQVDHAVEVNPALENEFVHRILMVNAYESEPDSRKDLEKVWK